MHCEVLLGLFEDGLPASLRIGLSRGDETAVDILELLHFTFNADLERSLIGPFDDGNNGLGCRV
jgi:hypothetical protein